jgi:hypothetical protein
MRTTLFLLAISAAPLAAQAVTKDAPDPDKKVAGGGTLPAGWSGRTDRPSQNLADAKFVQQGAGFHVTAGPPAIYWNPSNTASGNYTLRATFTQPKPSAHPEAYGLFFGGKNLDQPGQDYAYFIVRQNGQYMIKHRAGAETHTIVDWTAHPAIKPVAEGSAPAVNDLQVRFTADSAHFMVNGQTVKSTQRIGADGIYGLRVNHNLEVQIDNFGVTRP